MLLNRVLRAVPRLTRALGGAAQELAVAPRDPRYAALRDADVAAFRSLASRVLEGEEACAPYNGDWMNKWRGAARVVVKPATSAEVGAVLAYCDARGLAVVPQGGKTGLVGGSVPVHDEVVLSLTDMRAIEGLDAAAGVVTVEAGCVLGDLDDFLRARGFVAPLDLGSAGTCTVGGNLATNAGGIRFLRYGSLRGSCVGLEFVLADGTVVDCLSKSRKDNTGYALGQLLIGSEGTLGVVTRAALAVPPKPEAVRVAWLAVDSYDAVVDVLGLARYRLGEILSAVEFVDAPALAAVAAAGGAADPLAACAAPFRVLVETAGSDGDHDEAKLERFLTDAGAFVADGTVAPSESKARALWALREGVSDAMTAAGFVFKYDVSLPHDRLYALVEECRASLRAKGLAAGALVAGYGHVGDGNLHLNVCATGGYDATLHAALEPWVFEKVADAGGSISAEHGIGQCKAAYLHLNKPPPAIALMRTLKETLDPNAILNPYKVLPAAEAPAAAPVADDDKEFADHFAPAGPPSPILSHAMKAWDDAPGHAAWDRGAGSPATPAAPALARSMQAWGDDGSSASPPAAPASPPAASPPTASVADREFADHFAPTGPPSPILSHAMKAWDDAPGHEAWDRGAGAPKKPQ